MFNLTEDSDYNWTHYSVTRDGKITVFFEPHNHETIDKDDLEGTGEASIDGVTGQIVKKGAEKIKAGSTTGITEKAIKEDFQATHTARKEKEIEPE